MTDESVAVSLLQEGTDMSYLANPSETRNEATAAQTPQDRLKYLDNLGREIYTNSMGFAYVSAKEGVPYQDYQPHAITVPLRKYPATNTHYFAVSEAVYNSFA